MNQWRKIMISAITSLIITILAVLIIILTNAGLNSLATYGFVVDVLNLADGLIRMITVLTVSLVASVVMIFYAGNILQKIQ